MKSVEGRPIANESLPVKTAVKTGVSTGVLVLIVVAIAVGLALYVAYELLAPAEEAIEGMEGGLRKILPLRRT
jgi:uncharacterized membrane-anchored protein